MQFRLPAGTLSSTAADAAGTRVNVVLEHPERPIEQWQPVDGTLVMIIRRVSLILQQLSWAEP